MGKVSTKRIVLAGCLNSLNWDRYKAKWSEKADNFIDRGVRAPQKAKAEFTCVNGYFEWYFTNSRWYEATPKVAESVELQEPVRGVKCGKYSAHAPLKSSRSVVPCFSCFLATNSSFNSLLKIIRRTGKTGEPSIRHGVAYPLFGHLHRSLAGCEVFLICQF